MTRIGVRELRQNASVYLARVKAGEVVEVTERGRLIATIQSPSADRVSREELIASGRLVAARHPFTVPAERVPLRGETAPSELLSAARRDRIR